MTRSPRFFRKLSGATLLLALAVPTALSAQPPREDSEASGARARHENPRGRHGHGEGRHRHGHGADHHARVMRQLNLTDAQQAQLRVIREEARARAEQLRESGDRNTNRPALRALREETRRRMDAVLTEEQRQQAEALRTEARTERVGRRMARLQQTLGLSESQTARVRQVFEQAAGRRRAARMAGANLAPEARRAADRAQREQVNAELRQILTAEQMDQLEAERSHRRGRHRGRLHGEEASGR